MSEKNRNESPNGNWAKSDIRAIAAAIVSGIVLFIIRDLHRGILIGIALLIIASLIMWSTWHTKRARQLRALAFNVLTYIWEWLKKIPASFFSLIRRVFKLEHILAFALVVGIVAIIALSLSSITRRNNLPQAQAPIAPPAPSVLSAPARAHVGLFAHDELYWSIVPEATSYSFAVNFRDNRVYFSSDTWISNGQGQGYITGALNYLQEAHIQALEPWEIIIYAHAYGKTSSSLSIPMLWIPPATNIHIDGNYLRWNPVETAVQYAVWLEREGVSTDYKYHMSTEYNYVDLCHFTSWLSQNNIQVGDTVSAVIFVYSSAEDSNRYNIYEFQVPSLKLSAPVLAFDHFYGIISWEPVIGADIYDVFIRGLNDDRELAFTTGETYINLRNHAFTTDTWGTYYVRVVPSNNARTTYTYGDNKIYFLYVLWRFLPTPTPPPNNTELSAP